APSQAWSTTMPMAARWAWRKRRFRTQAQPRHRPRKISTRPTTTKTTKAVCRARTRSASNCQGTGLTTGLASRRLRPRPPLRWRVRRAGQGAEALGRHVQGGVELAGEVLEGHQPRQLHHRVLAEL